MSDTLRQLREVVARLGMVSHAATCSYDGRTPKSTEEDIGGKRPSGTDSEHPPRRPRPEAAPTAWAAYEDEMDAWRSSYQRRTVAYFDARLKVCADQHALEALLREAEETLQAWKRMPIPLGQTPEYGSPQWKRWIADSPESNKELARLFHVTAAYIGQIRKAYRQ